MSLKSAIENHLKGLASSDELFAVTFAKPNKSLDECCKYIMQEVGKMKKENNCVALPDDEVYKMAVHYYDEDSIVVGAKPVQATVSHSDDKNKPKVGTKREAQPVKVGNSITSLPQPKPVKPAAPVAKTKPVKKSLVDQYSLF